MRFQSSANGPYIADGPHRIEQTAAWPVQVVLTVPSLDVAKAIVFDALPLVPELAKAAPVPEPPEPAILPQPSADAGH
jgi:hypothetical protein